MKHKYSACYGCDAFQDQTTCQGLTFHFITVQTDCISPQFVRKFNFISKIAQTLFCTCPTELGSVRKHIVHLWEEWAFEQPKWVFVCVAWGLVGIGLYLQLWMGSLLINDERLKLSSMNTLLSYFGKPMIYLVTSDILHFRGIN